MLLAAVTTCLLTGCTSLLGNSADACSDPANRPAEVVTQPDLTEVSQSASNVDLQATSSLDERVRLTVRFDDAVALDVYLPGKPRRCTSWPVYQYTYRLPTGQAIVTATTDRGQREATTLTVAGHKRWVVVQIQDGFPLELDTWNSQPLWG